MVRYEEGAKAMSEPMSISIVVGFFMSPAISAITREKWSAQAQAGAAFGLCLLAAVVTTWFQGTLDWHDLRGVVIGVVGAAIVSFHLFWKPSGVADAVSKATG